MGNDRKPKPVSEGGRMGAALRGQSIMIAAAQGEITGPGAQALIRRTQRRLTDEDIQAIRSALRSMRTQRPRGRPGPRQNMARPMRRAVMRRGRRT